jgi:hypothetical protein
MQLDIPDTQKASIRLAQISIEFRQLSVAVSFPLALSSFSSSSLVQRSSAALELASWVVLEFAVELAGWYWQLMSMGWDWDFVLQIVPGWLKIIFIYLEKLKEFWDPVHLQLSQIPFWLQPILLSISKNDAELEDATNNRRQTTTGGRALSNRNPHSAPLAASSWYPATIPMLCEMLR